MKNELSALQKAELEILKAFISVCEKNGLRYYLLEGTCLGAVRHGGVIPWDDDIDVGLPRKDYEKLMEAAQKDLPDYYFLQNFKTDPQYPNCFAKIRDSRTTFIESSIKDLKINHGIYIDVFPLDFYPAGSGRIFKLRALLFKASSSGAFSSASLKIRFLRCISRVFYPGIKTAQLKYDAYLKALPESDKMTNVFSAWGDREIVPASWYGEGAKLSFNGIEATVPAEYKKYLTKIYGDYMTPPPPEKRIGTHTNEVIDLDKPYTEYIK